MDGKQQNFFDEAGRSVPATPGYIPNPFTPNPYLSLTPGQPLGNDVSTQPQETKVITLL